MDITSGVLSINPEQLIFDPFPRIGYRPSRSPTIQPYYVESSNESFGSGGSILTFQVFLESGYSSRYLPST